MERLQRAFERCSPGQGCLRHYLVVVPMKRQGDGYGWPVEENLPPGCPPITSAIRVQYLSLLPTRLGRTKEPRIGVVSLFYGDKEEYERFRVFAGQAGGLVLDLSRQQGPVLSEVLLLPECELNARAPVQGAVLTNDGIQAEPQGVARWMLLLHELGWLSGRGTPLRLTRFVWAGQEQMPYSSDTDLAERFRIWCGAALYTNRLMEENPIPPLRYYSHVGADLFGASAHAIDRLFEVLEGNAPPNPPAFSEPTDLISQLRAAEILGVSERTISRRIRDGVLGRFGGGRVSKAEVEQNRDSIRVRQPRTRRRTQ